MSKRHTKVRDEGSSADGNTRPLDPDKRCESCDKPRIKGERYCPKHRKLMLKRMEADNYFVETDERTVASYERIQNEEADLRRQNEVEEMMDRLDNYRDRASDNVPFAESV